MALPEGNPSNDSLLGRQKSPVNLQREQAVFLERAKLLFANIPATIFSTFILTPCLVFVNWEFSDHSILIAWLIYMVATMSFRLLIYIQFRRDKVFNDNLEKLVKLFVVGTILTAIGWAIAGSNILLSDSIPQQMFTTTLLAGLTAGALATLTPFYSIFAIFTLINLIPLTFTMLSFGTPYHYATSSLLIIFAAFILSASARMSKTIRQSISLQFQHDDALKDLAEKNQQADEYNKNLQHQINERKVIEQHLENSMSQLNATFESATDGILVIDNNEKITNYNQSLIDLFKIPDALLKQKNFNKVQEHINDLLKDNTSIIQSGKENAFLLQLNDGRLIELYSNPQKINDNIIGRVISYRDATMRINSESALQKAKNEAEVANRQKSDFLSRISHELRTPLNAILGFGHLLRENNNHNLNNEEKDYASHICQAGEHLLNLIDDLLDISRIESGKLNISLTNISCDTIINESLALVQSTANDNNITIHINAALDPMPSILTDHTRCKQALVNLLSNAIKYNTKNGSVTLTLTNQLSHIRFEISDTGIGIDETYHKNIFQPFTRLNQHEQAKGTGIGLTITKRLIEVMNGSIGMKSKPGKGSTFWFELPIATDEPQEKTTNKSTTAQDRVTNMEKTYTILYIEDEPLNQALVRSIVKQIPNANLITALTGEEGIELALKEQPDLILMDLNLPGISGYEALNVIRNEKSFSSVPVFAVSANAMPEEIQRGKEAGFFDYLIKPINIDNTRLLLSNTLSMLET